MLRLYKIIVFLSIPIIIINLYFRVFLNKEDRTRYIERLGFNSEKKNKNKKLIWIHAPSVGEFKSSRILIKNYYKDYQILVTTTTKTAADYIVKNHNKEVIHQYIPFDVSNWSKKFINYWKPNIVIWIESDLWPNILNIIKNKKIKCFYLNARISPKSYTKWKFLNIFYKNILNNFYKIYAQSLDDMNRIEKLYGKKISYIGNLKLANANYKKFDLKKKYDFSIMLASSHNNEEEEIANNIKKILNKKNKIKFFIAPRHPERTNSIIKKLNKINLSATEESKNHNDKSNIVIINSFGNLDKYFYLSDIVILGGSFVKKGGHNPVEPSFYNCVIISGCHIYNWSNVYKDMLISNACIVLNKTSEIYERILEFYEDRKKLNYFQNKALSFSKKIFFEKNRLFNDIDLVIK